MRARAFAVLALTVALAACRKQEAAPDESAGVKVRTMVVEPRAFQQTVLAIGAVVARPDHLAAVSAPGPARVSAVHVAVGQRVAAGTALVEFERAPFEAAARSADVTLGSAQAAHERAQRLVEAGVLARKDLDQAAAELAQAQAAAITAHRALELTILRAPLAGVVTSMTAVTGQTVDANQPLVEIVDPAQLDVVFAITPAEAARVRPGVSVELWAGEDAGAGPPLAHGTVSSVAAAVDTVTRSVAVRVHIARSSRVLRLGESVAGRISLGVHQDALVIPAAGLVPDGEAFKVFVVDSSGTARARTVTVGARADSLVEITDGLKAGETVATDGAYGLEDGVKVARGPS